MSKTGCLQIAVVVLTFTLHAVHDQSISAVCYWKLFSVARSQLPACRSRGHRRLSAGQPACQCDKCDNSVFKKD